MQYDPEATGPRHLVDAVVDVGFEASPVSGQRLGVCVCVCMGGWVCMGGPIGCEAWTHVVPMCTLLHARHNMPWLSCLHGRVVICCCSRKGRRPAQNPLAAAGNSSCTCAVTCRSSTTQPLCGFTTHPSLGADFVDNNRRETGVWWRQFRSAALLTLPVFLSERIYGILRQLFGDLCGR